MIDAARKLALIVDESDRIVTVIKLRNSDRRRSPKSARRAKAREVQAAEFAKQREMFDGDEADFLEAFGA